ncbi:hypothetical protein D3C77_668810 [compost metagenome]
MLQKPSTWNTSGQSLASGRSSTIGCRVSMPQLTMGLASIYTWLPAATIPPMALSTTRPSKKVRPRRPGMAAAMNANTAISSSA